MTEPLLQVSKFSGVRDNPLQITTVRTLDLVMMIEIAGAASFVADEKFRQGETVDGVKISWIGKNFEENFLSKIETNVAQVTLRIQKLKERLLDTLILPELGDTAETALAHFWELLKKQGRGQKGVLLINGHANTAYISCRKGNLWAVCAHWSISGNGWLFMADVAADPRGGCAGSLVVSR